MNSLKQINSPRTRSYINTAKRALSSASNVIVTKSLSAESNKLKSDHENSFIMQNPSLLHSTNATLLVDNLLQTTQSMMDSKGSNIIAYSGGVDSALVATLVQETFTSSLSSSPSSTTGNTAAILGVSPAVPASQIELARHIANDIVGIPLFEIPTAEGSDPIYIENKGQACLACKTALYSTLQSVAEHALSTSSGEVVMFNGTNQDDTTDPTRLGLIAADNFHVRSPLRHITKDQVRIAAKHMGLPNWNYAASPCLRSRLALGVEATTQHLKMVEEGETFVRNVLGIGMERNLRVRLLSGGRAGVELDEDFISAVNGKEISKDFDAKEMLIQAGFRQFLEELGFKSGEFVMRKFKSGAVAGAPQK